MKTWLIITLSVVFIILIILLIGYLSTAKIRLNKKFFTAVRNNDLSTVKKLISGKKIDMANYRDHNYCTPLSIAAMNGNIEMAKLFIENNADVDVTAGLRKYTPLLYAVKEDQLKMAEFLIDQGADVNAVFNSSSDGRYSVGITPLMIATANGNKDMAALLLDKGADIHAKNAWEITRYPVANMGDATRFAYMAKMDAKETVDYLFEQATKKYEGEAFFKPPFLLAMGTSNDELVSFLLEHGADPDWTYELKSSDNWSPPFAPGMNTLMYAAFKGNVKALELLLNKGLDVNAQDNFQTTALLYASKPGQPEAIKFLIQQGADVMARDSDNRDALSHAIGSGSTESVRILLEAGIAEGDHAKALIPVIYAADQGHTDIIDVLIKHGFDINETRKDGHNALDFAARKGDLKTMNHLIKKGAKINKKNILNARNKDGNTLLIIAARDGDTEAMKVLLNNGADINAYNNNGTTALMEASWFGMVNSVKLLLEKGADVNRENTMGETALAWAESLGQYVIEPEKAGQYVTEKSKEPNKEQLETKIAHLLRLRGQKAGIYMEGNANIFADITEEKKNDYREIIKLLKEAGAR